jgi:hypothetical protein
VVSNTSINSFVGGAGVDSDAKSGEMLLQLSEELEFELKGIGD